MAAEAGNGCAQWRLAVAYEDGLGDTYEKGEFGLVTDEEEEALKWY